MKAIDYEKESDKRLNWLDITGGTAKDSLTVLDYFAANALGQILASGKEMQWMDKDYRQAGLVRVSYQIAEAMLAERNKRFTPANVVTGVTGKTYG